MRPLHLTVPLAIKLVLVRAQFNLIILPILFFFGLKSQQLSLVEHQTQFLKQLVLSDLRGGIVFHGLGTGKTVTAVVSAHFYLKLHPDNKVLFISPSAVLFNFINSMIQHSG